MPIRSSVTVSLVPEARGGPFVFWDDLPAACAKAKTLGFDAIEVFPPSPVAIGVDALRTLLSDNGLALAAIGTGAGWLRNRLTLTHPEPHARVKAIEFIKAIIDLAGPLGASAIVGSMQGSSTESLGHVAALRCLAEALEILGEHAGSYGVPLVYEPLNRYETNLVNTIDAGVELLASLTTENVVLLADLFHMNIEEYNVASAILTGGKQIGHVHFVDSNRRPAGGGHIDFAPIAEALLAIGYSGFVSAEALPYPDSDSAAAATIAAFRHYFRGAG
jgi:sugar phosphate isomerase/epimerase